MSTINTTQLQFKSHGQVPDVVQKGVATLPAKPAKGHFYVSLRAAPINPSDELFINGVYDSMVGTEITQGRPQPGGAEGAGVVSHVGDECDKVKVGDRVYILKGFPSTGSWSEYIDIDANASLFTKIPDTVKFEEACQLWVNPFTVLGFLDTMEKDGVKKGDYYVMTAANSSLCRMLAQLAHQKGYKSIAVVRRQEVADELKGVAGYDELVVASTPEEVNKRILAITQNQGVKVAFDALGGGKVASAVIDSLSTDGTCYIYGGLSMSEPLVFNAGRLLFKRSAVKGWHLGKFVGENFPKMPQLFNDVLSMVEKKTLSLPYKSFAFPDQFSEAYKHSKAPGKQEKTVLVAQGGKTTEQKE